MFEAIRHLRGAWLAFSIMACVAGSAVAQQQPLPIRIGVAGASDHAPAFIGVEKGIFAKHGLDAHLVMYQSGVDMINGLLSGAQEVNIMGSAPFLAGVSRGQPLVLIGQLHGDPLASAYSDNESIVAGPNAGVKVGAAAGLKGKKIGLPRGTGAETYVLGMLAQSGLKSTDVTLINVAPANLATALRQGDVDAISVYEPWGSAALAKVPGAVRVTAGGCESCYDPGTVLTTRTVIGEKAEVLRRFTLAFAEAEQFVRRNRDAAADTNMHWMQGIDLPIMKDALSHSVFDPRVSRNMVEGYNRKAIPAMVADKRMAKVVDARAIIDPQFYLYALKTQPELFSDLPAIPSDQQLQ